MLSCKHDTVTYKHPQRQDTTANCSVCGGYKFIPCRKCGGSKNSVANVFTANFRALKCTSCSENGMEPCPACEEKGATTVEEIEEKEAIERERELREQRQREKIEQEKRERIKREALEAERQAQLEREELQREKERKKEKARLAKERKKRAAEAKQKIVADIAKELEREKQWQAEHDLEAEEETEEPKDDLNTGEDLGEEVNDEAENVQEVHGNNVDTDTLTVDEQGDSEPATELTPEYECIDENLNQDEVIEFEAPTATAEDVHETETHNTQDGD